MSTVRAEKYQNRGSWTSLWTSHWNRVCFVYVRYKPVIFNNGGRSPNHSQDGSRGILYRRNWDCKMPQSSFTACVFCCCCTLKITFCQNFEVSIKKTKNNPPSPPKKTLCQSHCSFWFFSQKAWRRRFFWSDSWLLKNEKRDKPFFWGGVNKSG